MVRRIILKSSSSTSPSASSLHDSLSSSSSSSQSSSGVASSVASSSFSIGYSDEDDEDFDFSNSEQQVPESTKLTARQRSKIEKDTFGDFEYTVAESFMKVNVPSKEAIAKKEQESHKRRLQKNRQMLKDKTELIGKLLQKQKCAPSNSKDVPNTVEDEKTEEIRRKIYFNYMKELDERLMNPKAGTLVFIDNERQGKSMAVNKDFINKHI